MAENERKKPPIAARDPGKRVTKSREEIGKNLIELRRLPTNVDNRAISYFIRESAGLEYYFRSVIHI